MSNDFIVREPPVSLDSLRAAPTRIIFPDNAFDPPKVDGSVGPAFPTFPTLPAPTPPAPPQAWAPAPFTPPPMDVPRREPVHLGPAAVEFVADVAGRCLTVVDGVEFEIHPGFARELVAVLLAAYSHYRESRLVELGTAFGLWSPNQEAPQMPAPGGGGGLLPEVHGQGAEAEAGPAPAVPGDGPLRFLWQNEAGAGPAVPDVLGEDAGSEPAPLGARPSEPFAHDGPPVSSFGGMRGEWFKPTHAGEAGGTIVGGPDRFLNRVPAGEHAANGGKPQRGKGKRKPRAKKSTKATAPASIPPSQE